MSRVGIGSGQPLVGAVLGIGERRRDGQTGIPKPGGRDGDEKSLDGVTPVLEISQPSGDQITPWKTLEIHQGIL